MDRKKRKERWRRFLIRILPSLLTLLVRLLCRTLRWRFHIPEEVRRLLASEKPFIVAFWHGQLSLMPCVFKRAFPTGSKIWSLISHHWDGEVIARTVRPFGIHAVRGSTTRGGRKALREMARALAEGRRLALAPDGPRGPRCKAQPGVTLLSQISGVPVVPIGWSAKPCVRLKSWDRFQIPAPLARVSVAFGDPFIAPSREAGEDLREHASLLEEELNRLSRQAEAFLRQSATSEWLYAAYNLILFLLTFPALPFLGWKLLSTPKYRAGFLQRLGFSLSPLIRAGLQERPIWVHAVSVGEVLATVPFVRRLEEVCPQQSIVVSTITPTGQKVAKEKFGDTTPVIYFPFDYPVSTRRLLKAVRPRLFVHTETEIWPNFLFLLAKLDIPSLIVNGRISARSCRQYGWFRFFFRSVLASVSAFGMQSKQDCLRIIRIGADPRRVFITGNMKFDVPQQHGSGLAAQAMKEQLGFPQECPVLAAGSTHPGEEEIILNAFAKLREVFPGLRLLLAPRHPERWAEVERMVRARNLRLERRTERRTGRRETDVFLLDTMGELSQAYSACDIVFVGGSLTPVGGHNLLEPIVHGKPVLFGRHMDNAADVARALKEVGGGIEVYDGDSLCREAVRLLGNPDQREAVARAAYSILDEHRGATERNIRLLRRFV